MFISKREYIELAEELKIRNKENSLLRFEIFKLRYAPKYKDCSLPNKCTSIRFDKEDSTDGLMEFMLLAEKKGIDLSELTIKPMRYGTVVYIQDKTVSVTYSVPHAEGYLDKPVHTAYQKERINHVPTWSEIRKDFADYIR